METEFYITLTIKTATGFESYGKFFLGSDKRFAYALFKNLAGQTEPDETSMLNLELAEMKDGLPVNLQMMSCTLDELADNCKTITKEVFKALNLKEM